MRSEEEIRDLIAKIKVTNFETEGKSGTILISDALFMLIQNLEWVLEDTECQK